jgi:ClpP class serine protease
MTYPLLLARYFNTPQLLVESQLNVLTSEVFSKLLSNEEINRKYSTPDIEEVETKVPDIAVIKIHGTLVNKNGAGASGITTYEGLYRSINEVIASGITNLLFDVSSGGGEADGNFPLTEFIASLPEKYGINTYGFTDSMAASGAYSILAATQKVFATDMAIVGSIGAVATIVDLTEADKQDGVKYIIRRSHDKKQEYNPHENISEEVLTSIDNQIKDWGRKFFDNVISHRPIISEDTLNSLAGGTVRATVGKDIGLVDQIVSSIDEVFPLILGKDVDVNFQKGTITMATLEETLAQLVDTQAKLAALSASKEADIKLAVQEEQQRCLKILEAKKTFGISETAAVNAISKNFSVDMVTTMFTEIKASLDEVNHIDTSSSPAGSVTGVTVADIAKLGQTQDKVEKTELGSGTFGISDLLNAMADVGKSVMGGK